MTPLNTITEEEKTTAEQLDEIALSRVTSINGVLVQMWDRNVLSAYIDGKLATAMQRAYEAGGAELCKELGIDPTKYAKWKKRYKEQLDSLTNHFELDQTVQICRGYTKIGNTIYNDSELDQDKTLKQ